MHPNPAPPLPQPPPKRGVTAALAWSQEGKQARGRGAQPALCGGPRKNFGTPCSAPPTPPQSLPFAAPQIPPCESCCAAGCGFARLPYYTQRPLQFITPPTLRCPALNHTSNPPPENLTRTPKTHKHPRSSPKPNISPWPSHPSPLPSESHIAQHHTEQLLHGKTWRGWGERCFISAPICP